MSTNGPNALYGGDGQTIDLDAAQAAWKAEQAKRNKPTTTTSDTKGPVDQVDIDAIANEKPENIAPPTSTSKNKSSGTLTYDKSYTPEVAKKWEAKGGTKEQAKANYIKAAKAWNTKKYGTTNPTADAKKAGITKDKLASQHAAKPKIKAYTESLTVGGKKYTGSDVDQFNKESSTLSKEDQDFVSSYNAAKHGTSGFTGVNKPHRPSTNTSNNTSLANTIAATNSNESLLGGVQTRREKRRQRQDDRIENRRQRQDDRRGLRSRKKWARGESKKSTTTTGLEGIKAESEKNLVAPKTETKKKKTGGEFWGKSGPIK